MPRILQITMTAVTAESPVRPRPLASLAAIMIRPRNTMRRILDAGRDRMILPLVLLVTLSSILGDVNRASLDAMRKAPLPVPFAVMIVAICAGVALIGVLFFYVFSWIAFGVSRLLEGTATAREIRSAMAWGAVPAIWALLYRLPAAVLWPGWESRMRVGSEQLVIKPSLMGMGCIGTVIFMALELAMFVWLLVVASNTLGEANRFSTARGFGTLVLTSISPLLIALAAVLAS